jgi:hypothetical protein
MLPPGPLFHKPKSIIAAINILYASLFLDLINWGISQFTAEQTGQARIEAIVVLVLTILVTFILIKKVGTGKKWARTILLVLFILGLAGFLWVAPAMFKLNLLVAIISLLITILEIIALGYLFSKDSTAWFDHVASFKRDEPANSIDKSTGSR